MAERLSAEERRGVLPAEFPPKGRTFPALRACKRRLFVLRLNPRLREVVLFAQVGWYRGVYLHPEKQQKVSFFIL